jgi:hypothetical protein
MNTRSQNFHFPHRRLRHIATATICRTLYASRSVKELMFVKSENASSEKMQHSLPPEVQSPTCE